MHLKNGCSVPISSVLFHLLKYHVCLFRLVKVSGKQSTGTSRKLQYTEKLFEDGCLNHETGVAVALLAQYVRWILETKTI
jgi:hypothetical protein